MGQSRAGVTQARVPHLSSSLFLLSQSILPSILPLPFLLILFHDSLALLFSHSLSHAPCARTSARERERKVGLCQVDYNRLSHTRATLPLSLSLVLACVRSHLPFLDPPSLKRSLTGAVGQEQEKPRTRRRTRSRRQAIKQERSLTERSRSRSLTCTGGGRSCRIPKDRGVRRSLLSEPSC